MALPLENALRDQLVDRRRRLETVLRQVGDADDLVRLLREVDSALKRMDGHRFGNCDVCHQSVDEWFLRQHPLITYCLCDLSPEQQRALEHDLGLASRVQLALLPPQDLRIAGWEVHHRYLPLGPASGDYCDVVARDREGAGLCVLFGDVSGKGLASSLVMARLNALFRTLVDQDLSASDLVERANRLLIENPVASHYATLVCAKAASDGAVELTNAGHLPPLVFRGRGVGRCEADGPPVGLFGGGAYTTCRIALEPGDTLLLYTDGLTESRNPCDEEYGVERLAALLERSGTLPPAALAAACLDGVRAFQAGAPRSDDLTLMVVRRL